MNATNKSSSQERVSEAMARLPPGAYLERLASAGCACPPNSVPDAAYLEMMLCALELSGTERVLEVGSGSGYETALLSQLAADVVSLNPDPDVAGARLRALLAHGCENVRLFLGHGPPGWPGQAPYHAILVAGAVPRLPTTLVDQLDLGGRLVAPLGDISGQLIEVVHKRADSFASRTLGPSHLPMLPWANQHPSPFPWNRDSTGG